MPLAVWLSGSSGFVRGKIIGSISWSLWAKVALCVDDMAHLALLGWIDQVKAERMDPGG